VTRAKTHLHFVTRRQLHVGLWLWLRLWLSRCCVQWCAFAVSHWVTVKGICSWQVEIVSTGITCSSCAVLKGGLGMFETNVCGAAVTALRTAAACWRC
jgi:hypothetical protein